MDDELLDAFNRSLYLSIISDEKDDFSSYHGLIIGFSATFVMLQAVQDWHSDGVIIFPRTRLDSIYINEHHEAQMNILRLNGFTKSYGYDWVKLSNFVELFWSIKSVGKTIVVSENDEAEVGIIMDVKKSNIKLKVIDPGGKWIDEPALAYYNNISSITFDDEYSMILKRYVDNLSL